MKKSFKEEFRDMIIWSLGIFLEVSLIFPTFIIFMNLWRIF